MGEIKPHAYSICASKKQAVIEQLWLTYYNDTLFAKGLITEEQRNRMRLSIRHRAEAKTHERYGRQSQ